MLNLMQLLNCENVKSLYKSNMNRLIKEISSHKFDQNLDVLCISAMRLHETVTPKGSNTY